MAIRFPKLQSIKIAYLDPFYRISAVVKLKSNTQHKTVAQSWRIRTKVCDEDVDLGESMKWISKIWFIINI